MPYDPAWPQRFADEARRLRQALGTALLGLEHIGSTAVPGLEAKPIIDILAATDPDADFDTIRRSLDTVGYLYTPKSSAPARIFRKGPADMDRLRTHHLHLTEPGGPYWRRILAFRDHLRRHPDDAAAYAELKGELAERFTDDRRSYVAGKHAFVTAIEYKAGIIHGRCEMCDATPA